MNVQSSPAQVTWKTLQTPDGTIEVPYSEKHDDVYFHLKGIEESEFVFLDPSQLKDRWRKRMTNDPFCVGELGFGTGLNFLLTWKRWCETKTTKKEEGSSSVHSHLTYVSIEKTPFSKHDLERAHRAWPELFGWSSVLLQKYPSLSEGIHSIDIAEDVTLVLVWEDCDEALNSWESRANRAVANEKSLLPQQVDAWYLDGFTPSKNESMWKKEFYHIMAGLSIPGTTVATFTSAGHVKRGLQEFGYKVKKLEGFDKKRDMIFATFEGHDPS